MGNLIDRLIAHGFLVRDGNTLKPKEWMICRKQEVPDGFNYAISFKKTSRAKVPLMGMQIEASMQVGEGRSMNIFAQGTDAKFSLTVLGDFVLVERQGSVGITYRSDGHAESVQLFPSRTESEDDELRRMRKERVDQGISAGFEDFIALIDTISQDVEEGNALSRDDWNAWFDHGRQ